jgi:hypothetical protein
MILTCCLRFGNGMGDFVPGKRFGMIYRYVRVEFSPERSNLCRFYKNLAGDLI